MSNAESILSAIKKLLFSDNKNRDITLNSLFVKVENAIYEYEEETFTYPWIVEFMSSGSDGQYAVFTDGGKLFRANYSIDNNDNVSIDEIYEVQIAYPKVESEKNRVTVFRSKEDELLWVGIASSAVLNRSGEIDSTKLFDDFENNFDDNEEPYLTLQHLPEEFSFGKIRGVFRLDSLLIAYGVIDEETVLGKFAEERFNSGEWGMSIGFMPTSSPEMVRIGDVEIPTYNSGVLVEISVLLETRAAAYFTKIIGSEKGKNRMANKTKDEAKKLLLEFSDGKAEGEIDDLLDEAGKRERQISEENLITRDNEDDVEIEDEEVEEEVTEEESEEENTNDEIQYVIDDATIEKIVNSVSINVRDIFGEKLKELDEFNKLVTQELDQVKESVNRVNDYIEEIKTRTSEQEDRLKKVEQGDNEKIRQAVDDLPPSKKRKVVVTHRPTENNIDTKTKTTRELANETLSNIGVSEKIS
jgi:hypothetical protein